MAELAAAEATFVSDEIGPFLRGELRGERGAVVAPVVGLVAAVALHGVDLGGNVIDSNADVHVINVHGGRTILGSTDVRPVRKKDRVDQGGLGDGIVQRCGLAEPDLLSGITFEPLHIPMKGGIVIESGDTAAKAAEFVSIGGNSTLALAQGFQSLPGSGYGVGRGEEAKESPLEIFPGTGDGETAGSPPGFGVISEVKRRVLHPLVSSELDHRVIFFLVVNEILTRIRVVFPLVGRGCLRF
jgi:hypothetical protein